MSKQICGKCIHIDVCYVPRTLGCVDRCDNFRKRNDGTEQTNFERISASPEALAKVIMGIVTSCEAHGYNGYCLFDDFDFDEFMKDMEDYDEEVGTKTEYEHYKEVLMWLKQESTE